MKSDPQGLRKVVISPHTPMVRKRPGHIYHITDNHSPANPGITGTITPIVRYLAEQGWPTTVLAAGEPLTPVPKGVGINAFPIMPGGQIWRYPERMGAYLANLAALPGNIFHLHGVWMAPQWLAARVAYRHGVPTVLTPNDMLSPWHWRDGLLRHLKKMIYWHTLAYPGFRKLSMIHAVTPRERDNLAVQFPGLPLEIIPNSIDLEEADKSLGAQESTVTPVGSPYLLFVGRLHPKKGIDILIEAFARARKPFDCRLLIVGPDSTPEYTAKLKGKVRALQMEQQVIFLGPVFDENKWALYRHAWAFCAPSHSETVGLVNLEAAAAGVPVLTTYETGLYNWQNGGGLLVHPRVEELTLALEQVFSWGENERQDRGRKLRQLVERRYSWKAVGPLWLELYAKILAI
jgi:glycosyltransferase involved in cell wall biosynthesis